jgi:hypothetical protein
MATATLATEHGYADCMVTAADQAIEVAMREDDCQRTLLRFQMSKVIRNTFFIIPSHLFGKIIVAGTVEPSSGRT